MRKRLRWLLVLLVTLLAILAFAVIEDLLWPSREADRAWREKLDGQYQLILRRDSMAPKWLISLVGESINDKYFKEPAVAARAFYADDELLNYLATISSLETIWTVNGSGVTDTGIAKLKTLKKLSFVYLQSTNIDDEAAEALATIHSLEFLYVVGKSFSYKAL